MTKAHRGVCAWCGRRVDITPKNLTASHDNGDLGVCDGALQPPAYTFRVPPSRELWLEDILGEPKL